MESDGEDQYCLKWNNHQRTIISVFDYLLESSTLVDCTLAADGQCLKAHKVVLSACSPYLGMLLTSHTDRHPIVILNDISFQELKYMLHYMYRGEVCVSRNDLERFLKAAESLQIKGLTDNINLDDNLNEQDECVTENQFENSLSDSPPPPQSVTPVVRNFNKNRNYRAFSSNRSTFSPQQASQPVIPAMRSVDTGPSRKRRRYEATDEIGNSQTRDNHRDAQHAELVSASQDSDDSTTVTANSYVGVASQNVRVVEDGGRRYVFADEANAGAENANVMNQPVSDDDSPQYVVSGNYDGTGDESQADDGSADEDDEAGDMISVSQHNQQSGSDGNQQQLDSEGLPTGPDAAEDESIGGIKRKYACKLCGKQYRWKQSLTRHNREHRCDKGPQHACPLCGIIFKHTTRLNRHRLHCPRTNLSSEQSQSSLRYHLYRPPHHQDDISVSANYQDSLDLADQRNFLDDIELEVDPPEEQDLLPILPDDAFCPPDEDIEREMLLWTMKRNYGL